MQCKLFLMNFRNIQSFFCGSSVNFRNFLGGYLKTSSEAIHLHTVKSIASSVASLHSQIVAATEACDFVATSWTESGSTSSKHCGTLTMQTQFDCRFVAHEFKICALWHSCTVDRNLLIFSRTRISLQHQEPCLDAQGDGKSRCVQS